MAELTNTQLNEWEAYNTLQPIESWRQDYQYAMLNSTITNLAISIHGKKGAKMSKPLDFMPQWGGKEEKIQTIEEMKMVLRNIANTFKNKKK